MGAAHLADWMATRLQARGLGNLTAMTTAVFIIVFALPAAVVVVVVISSRSFDNFAVLPYDAMTILDIHVTLQLGFGSAIVAVIKSLSTLVAAVVVLIAWTSALLLRVLYLSPLAFVLLCCFAAATVVQ